MGKRSSIVLNYEYNDNWIGGTYYVLNLIHALNTIDDAEKPIIYINSPNDGAVEKLYSITQYPYLKFYGNVQLHPIVDKLNLIYRKIFKKNLFNLLPKVEVFFPVLSPLENIPIENQLFWIPDFQEKHLPKFFSQQEIADRHNIYSKIKATAKFIVFSSHDALKDFKKFYDGAKATLFVLNFATFHNKNTNDNTTDILSKYSIQGRYFLCSNQFWAHKNHIVILKAISELQKNNIDIQVVFTGKEQDYRNPDFFSNLKKQTTDLGIENHVKYLGFISREDQIVLLKNCTAIIQPSLFEGWSTVNEDAKAQNTFILASDLAVNREQLSNYPNYRLFDPNDANHLAQTIQEGNFECKTMDYHQNIVGFGNKFLQIIDTVKKTTYK